MKELNNSNFLFKFQKCGDRLNESLKNNTIFFSSIENFNDPFETMFSIKSWNNHAAGEDYFYDRIFPHTALARVDKQEHHTIIKSRREGPAKEIMLHDDLRNSILAMIRDLYGVACFSSSHDELLMWSHYSNIGNGVCLIFDKEILFNKNIDGYPRIEQVNYLDKLPAIDVRLSENRIHFDITPLITSKRKNWSYENEIRAFIYMGKLTSEISLSNSLLNGNDKRLRNLKFNPNAFKGLIFGHNCSLEDREVLKSILKANDKIDFDALIFAEAKINSHSGQYIFRRL